MINKVILMGRLTKTPELKYTNRDMPVCSFTIAVDSGYGENKKADFLTCVAWNKTAEFISKFFEKGSMIAVVGRLSTRVWESQEGRKNYVTEVIINEASFCGSKKETGSSLNSDSSSADDDFVMLDENADDLPF